MTGPSPKSCLGLEEVRELLRVVALDVVGIGAVLAVFTPDSACQKFIHFILSDETSVDSLEIISRSVLRSVIVQIL